MNEFNQLNILLLEKREKYISFFVMTKYDLILRRINKNKLEVLKDRTGRFIF